MKTLIAKCMRVCLATIATAFSILIIAILAPARAAEIEVLYLGHSTTRITSQTGKIIVIDPFLSKNPMAPSQYKDLKSLGKVDLILVTHGHNDHVGDLVQLASLSGASVVANFEYAVQVVALGMLDAKKTIAMNKGGTVSPLGRSIKIHMVPAEHSSSVDMAVLSSGGLKPKEPRYLNGGVAVGYVIELENGFRIYHAGDTHVFGDMALIRKLFRPDLALVPIGGHFTMDPEAAAYAVRELLQPKEVIPIHYGTYPIINRTANEFKVAMGKTSIKILDLKPGQSIHYR